MNIESIRWCIYIDIEGFGNLYGKDNIVILALHDLMEGIFLIGEKCYPDSPNRIFAHQTGDGFAIVGEFHSEPLQVPIAISIALLRHVAANGRFAKASIGEGDFADITGLYPDCVRKARRLDGSVRMGGSGGSLMNIFTVMGTALINAHTIGKKSPSGSLLTLASSNRDRLPSECIVKDVSCGELLSIDWVHSELDLVYEIQRRAGLRRTTIEVIKQVFDNYISSPNHPPKHWISSTKELLNL